MLPKPTPGHLCRPMANTRLSDQQRRNRLGHRHTLTSAQATNDVETIVRSVLALHASDPATVYLSCVARMKDPSIEAIEKTIYEDRSVVRHHAMRRTIWVMSKRAARLAHATATEKIAAGETKRTVKALVASDVNKPEEWLAAAKAEVVALLAKKGSMSTREVGQALPDMVIPLEFGSEKHSATLNAHTKVLQGAGFDGIVVRGKPGGTWISSEYPWSVTEDWLGEPLVGLDTREAAAELVDLWLRQFGPATEEDIVWWFGVTKTLVRNALGDSEAEPVMLDGDVEGWVGAGDTDDVASPDPWVRLLPGLDPTSMGWKLRDFYLNPDYLDPLFDRFGNIGPTIWADGRIVGGWIQRDDATIVTELFEKLSKKQQVLLDEAIDQMGTALGDVVVRPRFPARMQKTLLA